MSTRQYDQFSLQHIFMIKKLPGHEWAVPGYNLIHQQKYVYIFCVAIFV